MTMMMRLNHRYSCAMFYFFALVVAVMSNDNHVGGGMIVEENDPDLKRHRTEQPPPFHNTECPDGGNNKIVKTTLNDPYSSSFHKYHGDDTCHRQGYNDMVHQLNRSNKQKHFKQLGTMEHIPNEQSIYCPVSNNVVQPWDDEYHNNNNNENRNIGLDALWIVENKASTPIVLSYINSDGIEVSAKNSKIYPAIHDSTSILQPGQWTAIVGYEGHVFIARSIINISLGIIGPILLQHRIGFIPIGIEYLKKNIQFQCPTVDIEPMNPITHKIESEYSRTPRPVPLKHCHSIDLGFRNMLNCPIHGYYVTKQQSQESQSGDVNDMICSERFKFHLGTQATNNFPNVFMDWKSNIKYENTFIDHIFRFRLASNPNVIVDTITVKPTYIYDCPLLTSTSSIGTGTTTTTAESIASNEGRAVGISSSSSKAQQQQQYNNISSSSYVIKLSSSSMWSNMTSTTHNVTSEKKSKNKNNKVTIVSVDLIGTTSSSVLSGHIQSL